MDLVGIALLLVLFVNPAIGLFIARRATPREVDAYYIIGHVGLLVWTAAMIPYRIADAPDVALLWYRVVLSGSTLLPLSLMGAAPMGRSAFSKRDTRDFLLIFTPNILTNIAIWLPGCVVAVTPRAGLEPLLVFGPLYGIYVAYMFFAINWVILLLLWKMSEDEPLLVRQQVRWKLTGIVVPSIFGFVTNVLLPIFQVVFINYGAQLVSPVYTGSMLYAMVRYRFQDLDQVLKRGLVYFVISGLLTAVYLVSVQFLQVRFTEWFSLRWDVLSALLLILFAFLFQPLRDSVQNLVDRFLGRLAIDYRMVLRRAGLVLMRVAELTRLVRISGRVVYGGLNISGLMIAVRDKSAKEFEVMSAFGNARGFRGVRFPDNMSFMQYTNARREPTVRLAVEEEYHAESIPEERAKLMRTMKEMIELKSMVVMGAFGRGQRREGKMLAILALGEKRNGEPFRSEELHTLAAIANQLGGAIENAVLYADLKEKYAELRVVQDKLHQAEKLAALGTMAAGIAHEIKNPLAAMKMFTELPLHTLEKTEYREKFLQVIIPEIDRLDRIVNELLQYARPTRPHFEPVALPELVQKSLRILEIRFQRNRVSVQRSFAKTPPVFADPSKMMQVLINLLGNAIEAMPEGGTIYVRIVNALGTVRLEIEDTGVGVAKDKLKSVFTPFYTTRDKGTGLGLAITQRIVEEHRGTIWMESEVGRGAKVSVEFPEEPAHQLELVTG